MNPSVTAQNWYNSGTGLISSDTCDFSTVCDYSNSPSGYDWTISTNGLWQIGSTTKPFFSNNGFNQKALMTDTLSAYEANDTSFFEISAYIGGWGPYFLLEFQHKFETDTLLDGGFITISFDLGDTWFNIGDLPQYGDYSIGQSYYEIIKNNIYNENDTFFNGGTGFSGVQDWMMSGFQFVYYPIKAMNDPEYLLIRFNFISDSIHNEKDGWIIRKLILSLYEPYSSVDSYQYQTSVSIYPNPVDENFTIDFKDYLPKGAYEVEIINNLGQMVKRFERNTIYENSFSISELEPGLYSVKIIENNKVLSLSKLIKE